MHLNMFGGHGRGRVPRFRHHKFWSNRIVQMWTFPALIRPLRKRQDCSDKKKPRADHIRRKSAANFKRRSHGTLQNGSSHEMKSTISESSVRKSLEIPPEKHQKCLLGTRRNETGLFLKQVLLLRACKCSADPLHF